MIATNPPLCLTSSRFTWRLTPVLVLGTTHSILILSRSQTQIISQYSLPDPLSSLTSTRDTKAMVYLVSLSSVISARMETNLYQAPRMDVFTFTTLDPPILSRKSRRTNNHAQMLLSIQQCLMPSLHVAGVVMFLFSNEMALFLQSSLV